MSRCEQLSAQAASSVSATLRAVDCLAGETTAGAFARLFGGGGALLPALTILLTLYIAIFAFALLTGRSRLGVAALSGRMVTLGLVLTFATSWIAYQQVVWTLATAAPDQVAALVTGSPGPATQVFAERIDLVFGALADVAGEGSEPAQAATAAAGMASPSGVVWLGAVLLLLGTAGVLVTARIALAVLLATGPVFVVLALFPGTRGLTAGWLRGVAMTALVPLYVVVGGGIALELLVPVIAGLRGIDGEVSGRAAMALFLVAAVHCALMVLSGRVTATVVSAWSVFGLAGEGSIRRTVVVAETAAAPAPAPGSAVSGSRTLIAPPGVPVTAETAYLPATSASASRTVIHHAPPALLPLAAPRRARGIGSRFAPMRRPAVMLR